MSAIKHRKGAAGVVSAYVGDSRVRVSDIAQMYDAALLELISRRIQEALPHLSEAQILEAIRYWQSHPDEIAKEIERDENVLHSLQSAV